MVWGVHLNGFEILILFHILHDCISLVKFQIEIRFFIELHGNSKLSMTSCHYRLLLFWNDKDASMTNERIYFSHYDWKQNNQIQAIFRRYFTFVC